MTSSLPTMKTHLLTLAAIALAAVASLAARHRP